MEKYLDLQFFSEGASAGNGAEGFGEETAQGNARGENSALQGIGAQNNSEIFGTDHSASDGDSETQGDPAIRENPAQGENPAEEIPDREGAFDALIKGEFREEYDRRVRRAVERRFKRARAAEEELARLTPLTEYLAQSMGLDTENTEALVAALREKGEREQTARRETEEREKQTRLQREAQFAAWMEQSRALQQREPQFDFIREVKGNPAFGKMLTAGLTVEQAFRAVHMDAFLHRAGEQNARNAGLAVVNSVRANGLRPVENGLNAQTPTRVKTDLNALTLEQINDLFARSQQGERITFN